MDDQEFKLLKLDIQKTMDALETLQSIYKRKTGRRFVSGRGIGPQAVEADIENEKIMNNRYIIELTPNVAYIYKADLTDLSKIEPLKALTMIGDHKMVDQLRKIIERGEG